MGLFDTFILDPPILCGGCGAKIASVQSKSFDSALDMYRVGDLVRGTKIRSGIVEEESWCPACAAEGPREKIPVFIVVWNGIYAGSRATMDEAERLSASVDRLTLISWLADAQEERDALRRAYSGLRGALTEYREYTVSEDKTAFLASPFSGFRSGLKELSESSDPLGMILERYANADPYEGEDIFR